METIRLERDGDVLVATIDHPDSAMNAVDGVAAEVCPAAEMPCILSADHAEAVDASVAGRQPTFHDRRGDE